MGLPSFPIHDHRRPGQPMAALPLKLPTASLATLQAQADRLQCSRGGLARALLLQGVERLEQTITAEGVV